MANVKLVKYQKLYHRVRSQVRPRIYLIFCIPPAREEGREVANSEENNREPPYIDGSRAVVV